MGGTKDRSEDIEMGNHGMLNSPPSEASSIASDPKQKMAKKAKRVKKAKKEVAGTDVTEPMEPNYQPVNWKRVFFTPKYIPVWIILIVVAVLTAIITLKHDQVVSALRPFAEKVRNVPAGWLVFVAVLFIISFPPLFGHEVVALLAGVVYGLWIGFAVVSAGTFIGEIGTWFAFKNLLRKKAEKMERTNLTYGAMARLCRDGGFWIVFVIRFSIIPSHLSTAVFSTCDVKFWHFAISTFLTLPKQLILVYLGVLLVEEQDGATVKNALFGVAGAVTVLAGAWIWFKMAKYKKQLLKEQAERQASKEAERLDLTTADSGYGTETGSVEPAVGYAHEPMPSPSYKVNVNDGVVYHAQPSFAQSLGTPPQHQQQAFSPFQPEAPTHLPYPCDYNSSVDVSMATIGQSDSYGPPSYEMPTPKPPPAYPLRKVDSAENGRLAAQGRDFV